METLLQYAASDSEEECCDKEAKSSDSIGEFRSSCERHDSFAGVVKDTTSNKATPTSEREDGAVGCASGVIQSDSAAVDNEKGVDFFGMTADSSSDSGEDDKYVKSKSNMKMVTESSKLPFQFPESEFWKETSKVNSDEWTRPELVWKDHLRESEISHPKKFTDKHKLQVRDQESFHAYHPKRVKTNQHSKHEDQAFTMSTSRPLQKSCYFVHHKIAPFLTQSNHCSVPKRRQVDLDGHARTINRLQWCPHSYSHLLLSASMDTSIKIWNAFSSVSHCVQTMSFHTKAVRDAVWTSNGRQIITAGYDRTARLLDVEKGAEVTCFDHRDFVSCVECHPVNHNYFITGSLNVINCWDLRSGSNPFRVFTYKEPFGQVQDMTFLPNGAQFVSCNDIVSRDAADRTIMAWDFSSGVVISNQIFQERFTCTRLRTHPHEAQFIAQTQGDYMALFSTIKPFKIHKGKRYEGHKVLGYNVGCDFSPDGRYIASGSSDGQLSIYDFQTSKCLRRLNTGRDVCLDVAWHPVLSSTVAMATWGGKISIWS